MPYQLDELDLDILKSLLKDGRKSLRQISRELKVSTPTVNIRYQRLLNIGLIKSITPIIDTSKLDTISTKQLEECHCLTEAPKMDLTTNTAIKIQCDLCNGPVPRKPHVYKVANIERFFCCTTCKATYKEKYKGRIKSLIKKS